MQKQTWPVLAILAGALAASPLAAQTTAAGVDTVAIRAHTRFLTDDLLEGRGTGTRGEALAAAYIESQLMRLGVARIGDSWQHPVPLVGATIAPGTRLELRTNAATRAFETPRDFVWNTGGARAFRDFEGDVLFAGTPAEAADALRGVELRGAVVAIVGLPGAAASWLVPDWIERGVAGVLCLAPEPGYYDLVVRSRGGVRYYVDADVGDPVWQPDLPIIVAGPELTRALFHGRDAADAPPFRLAATLAATIRVNRESLRSANVAGLLRGSDPARAGEVVVYTAHYDHLGIGLADATGDSIYSGFSDNAAGVAMLLAIAERLAEQPPAHSTAFLFFAAEERGLLGSSYFAARPPLQLDGIRALINLDAGAPPAPPVSWRIAAGEHADEVVAAAASVARRRGWTVDVGAATPNSDHWPFASRGVPAIFIIPGPQWEGVSEAQARALRARWDRYHQPGDRWDEAFPFAGLGRYADFALEVGREAGGRVR
jgi:hypothetical protein